MRNDPALKAVPVHPRIDHRFAWSWKKSLALLALMLVPAICMAH